MNTVIAEGIPCFTGSCSEIYIEKAFVKAGIGPGTRLHYEVMRRKEKLAADERR